MKRKSIDVSCVICQIQKSNNSDSSKEYNNLCDEHLKLLKDNCHIQVDNVRYNIVTEKNAEDGHTYIRLNNDNWLDIYNDNNENNESIIICLCVHSQQKETEEEKKEEEEEKMHILKEACFYVMTNNGERNKQKCKGCKESKKSCYCIKANDGSLVTKVNKNGHRCDALLYHCSICDIEGCLSELKQRPYVCKSHQQAANSSKGLLIKKENLLYKFVNKSGNGINSSYKKVGSFHVLNKENEQLLHLYFKKGKELESSEWMKYEDDLVIKKCVSHKNCYYIAKGLPKNHIQVKGVQNKNVRKKHSECNHVREFPDIVDTFESNNNYNEQIQKNLINKLKDIIAINNLNELESFCDNQMIESKDAYGYLTMLLIDPLSAEHKYVISIDNKIVERQIRNNNNNNKKRRKTNNGNHQKSNKVNRNQKSQITRIMSKLKIFLLCLGIHKNNINNLAVNIWNNRKHVDEIESKIVDKYDESWGTGRFTFVCDSRKHRNAYNIMLENKRVVFGVFRKNDNFHMFVFARSAKQPFGEYFKINERITMDGIVHKHWELTSQIRKCPEGYANPENKENEMIRLTVERWTNELRPLIGGKSMTVTLNYDNIKEIRSTYVDGVINITENTLLPPSNDGSEQLDKDQYHQIIVYNCNDSNDELSATSESQENMSIQNNNEIEHKDNNVTKAPPIVVVDPAVYPISKQTTDNNVENQWEMEKRKQIEDLTERLNNMCNELKSKEEEIRNLKKQLNQNTMSCSAVGYRPDSPLLQYIDNEADPFDINTQLKVDTEVYY